MFAHYQLFFKLFLQFKVLLLNLNITIYRQEARVARAYALCALESLPELLRAHGAGRARAAALWAALHAALARDKRA